MFIFHILLYAFTCNFHRDHCSTELDLVIFHWISAIYYFSSSIASTREFSASQDLWQSGDTFYYRLYCLWWWICLYWLLIASCLWVAKSILLMAICDMWIMVLILAWDYTIALLLFVMHALYVIAVILIFELVCDNHGRPPSHKTCCGSLICWSI